jgi:hypothetical protein
MDWVRATNAESPPNDWPQPTTNLLARALSRIHFYMEVGEGQVSPPTSSVAIHVAIQRTNRAELPLRRVFARQIRIEIDRFRHF